MRGSARAVPARRSGRGRERQTASSAPDHMDRALAGATAGEVAASRRGERAAPATERIADMLEGCKGTSALANAHTRATARWRADLIRRCEVQRAQEKREYSVWTIDRDAGLEAASGEVSDLRTAPRQRAAVARRRTCGVHPTYMLPRF